MQTASRRHSPLLLTILAVLFVLVPFLFWRDTWFGRRLSGADLAKYLGDTRHPRKIQHALSQVADRIMQGDPATRAFYPQIESLARHPLPEIRNTAAWVMGQDNSAESFHRALLGLLKDPVLMVRRNAALALVRFQDPSGRSELVEALEPYGMRAASEGVVSVPVKRGDRVGAGSLIARIKPDGGREVELRAPYAGEIAAVRVRDGARVNSGDLVAFVSPDPDQVWEALRGLHRIGGPEDLEAVERYENTAVAGMPARVREQALYTAEAIRTRSEHSPSR